MNCVLILLKSSIIFFFNRPAPILAAQISIDDCRRCELANILRDKESREVVRIIDK
jgi:hypothetical protein